MELANFPFEDDGLSHAENTYDATEDRWPCAVARDTFPFGQTGPSRSAQYWAREQKGAPGRRATATVPRAHRRPLGLDFVLHLGFLGGAHLIGGG